MNMQSIRESIRQFQISTLPMTDHEIRDYSVFTFNITIHIHISIPSDAMGAVIVRTRGMGTIIAISLRDLIITA